MICEGKKFVICLPVIHLALLSSAICLCCLSSIRLFCVLCFVCCWWAFLLSPSIVSSFSHPHLLCSVGVSTARSGSGGRERGC